MLAFFLLNILLQGFASDTDFSIPVVEDATNLILNFPTLVIVGIILIAITIFIIFFLKKIIVNSVLGLALWGVALFIFNVELPLVPSLVVSIIIGPAGIGTMLLLNAFGLLIV